MKNLATANHAFGLPAGSIRGLLAIIVFVAIWSLMIRMPDQAVPSYLQNLMFIILGHYFATRAAHKHFARKVALAEAEGRPLEPNPLYLPNGSIRLILILGFIAVGIFLAVQSQWWINNELSQSGITLILAAGFLLGVLRGYFFKRERRWLEDVRATISLAAATALLLMVFGYLSIPEIEGLRAIAIKFRYEEVLAAIVGFYFGSKT